MEDALSPDANALTEGQQRKLCEMMYYAFIELRLLGWAGKSEQAADLADTFHNLPNGLWQGGFNLQFFRDTFLKPYHSKYREGGVRDYVEMLEEIIAMTK